MATRLGLPITGNLAETHYLYEIVTIVSILPLPVGLGLIPQVTPTIRVLPSFEQTLLSFGPHTLCLSPRITGHSHCIPLPLH